MKRLAFLCLFVSLAAACKSKAPVPRQPPEPVLEHREKRNPKTGELLRSWAVLRSPDGPTVQHGEDVRWFETGVRESEASFSHGEPVGLMRRWYENGQLRSECTYDPEGRATPMRFWHENGQFSAEGMARRGERTGLWTFWFEDGKPREKGECRDGERTGTWTIHHPDGSVRSRGRYENGDRVGYWEHFEVGELFD